MLVALLGGACKDEEPTAKPSEFKLDAEFISDAAIKAGEFGPGTEIEFVVNRKGVFEYIIRTGDAEKNEDQIVARIQIEKTWDKAEATDRLLRKLDAIKQDRPRETSGTHDVRIREGPGTKAYTLSEDLIRQAAESDPTLGKRRRLVQIGFVWHHYWVRVTIFADERISLEGLERRVSRLAIFIEGLLEQHARPSQ